MTQNITTPEPAHIENLHLEVKIKASTEAVWQALTDDIGAWWPSDSLAGSGREGATGRFVLEAHPGGRMWEDWGDGNGLLWGNVVNITHGTRLDIVGTTGPEWGGPALWYGSFKVDSDGNGAVFRFSDSGLGRVSAKTTADKTKDWTYLFDTMRAHIEGTEPPEW